MSIASGIVVYICTWWVVIFCVLPWGIEPHQEEGTGTAGSAPKNPRLKEKFIITSIISAVISALIYALIQMELINFYDEALEMWMRDMPEQ